VVKQHKSVEDTGEFLPAISLAKEIGTASCAESLRLARQHARSCLRLGGQYRAWNPMLGCWTWLWARRLMRCSSIKEWEAITEGVQEINVWEQRMEEEKVPRERKAITRDRKSVV
jgi:hypothetical protein